YDCSLSIMVPKNCYFYRIEPNSKDRKKAKLTWKGKVFRVLWEYPQNKHIDKRLRLTVKQGICGKVYTTGRPQTQNLTLPSISHHQFTEYQERMVKDYK